MKKSIFLLAILAVGLVPTVLAVSDIEDWTRAHNPSEPNFEFDLVASGTDQVWFDAKDCDSARCAMTMDSFTVGEEEKSFSFWFSPRAASTDIGFDDSKSKHYGYNTFGMHTLSPQVAILHDGTDRIGFIWSNNPILVNMTVTADGKFVIDYDGKTVETDVSELKGEQLTPRFSWSQSNERVLGLQP